MWDICRPSASHGKWERLWGGTRKSPELVRVWKEEIQEQERWELTNRDLRLVLRWGVKEVRRPLKDDHSARVRWLTAKTVKRVRIFRFRSSCLSMRKNACCQVANRRPTSFFVHHYSAHVWRSLTCNCYLLGICERSVKWLHRYISVLIGYVERMYLQNFRPCTCNCVLLCGTDVGCVFSLMVPNVLARIASLI